ncbi:nitrilase-related carbon-nitrogen hydrolase [uncultured Microbacterium sp.]|uniref:nitrilase-related carbon-nitrogen hydrolase n=1 Tax=uncultured Microbacterium sp. TaxID=191216 RepID=UPI00260D9482|nr:nitrilase-related carbon-nitrogen hydrolase [uncultured Microbacterium sp.]
MKVILRIAAVQAEASTGGVDHNIAKAVDFIQRASAEKVDVIVFPEAFVTGYDDAAFTGPLPASKDLDWLDPVQQAVDETGMLVVLNTALDRGGSSTLTDIVLSGELGRGVPARYVTRWNRLDPFTRKKA